MHSSVNLVMIVRNESRCLARCLSSIRPWVDAMIVLDTGSTDDTVALAQAQGARVAHVEWVDDFAKARNAALDLSDADWNVVLDADEWLTSGGEVLQSLRGLAPEFIGSIEVASQGQTGSAHAADQGITVASSWLPRVLPRGVRYEGRVHEQPVFDGPRQRLSVRIEHDGYMPAQMQLKGNRNRRLLQDALGAKPDDAYLNYQLGKDFEVHDEFGSAWPYYELALALLEAHGGRMPSWRHDLVLRSLFVLKATGQVPQAIQLAEAEMAQWPESPDFFFVMGDVLLEHAVSNPDDAEAVVPMIEAAWLQCLAIGENPGQEGAVQGRGSFLAARNLSSLYETLGRDADAAYYRALAEAAPVVSEP